MDDLIRIGKLLGPFGVGGAIKLYVIGDPARLMRLKRVQVEGLGWVKPQRIERHGPGLVLQLPGIETREAAERLQGRAVDAAEAELPPLPDGEYHYHDLIGLPVQRPSGQSLGTVKDVIDAGHQDLLVVETGQGDGLVPLQAPYVEVALGRAIVLDAPPGLLPGDDAPTSEQDA